MNHKTVKNYSVSFLLFFTFLLIIFNSNPILANPNLKTDDWLSYSVLSASETTNAFFGNFPPGTYYGEWSVVDGDNINYNITSVRENEINGTLFLGNVSNNVTFFDVRNIDVAFGLTLGIYPWNGGFLANASNWETIQTLIQGTNTTVTEIDNFNHEIEGEQHFYSVIQFNTSNYYGQFSLLHYHSTSGVLLRASTSYSLYELSISLSSTSLELEVQTQTAGTKLVSLLPIMLLILAFPIFRRRNSRGIK